MNYHYCFILLREEALANTQLHVFDRFDHIHVPVLAEARPTIIHAPPLPCVGKLLPNNNYANERHTGQSKMVAYLLNC